MKLLEEHHKKVQQQRHWVLTLPTSRPCRTDCIGLTTMAGYHCCWYCYHGYRFGYHGCCCQAPCWGAPGSRRCEGSAKRSVINVRPWYVLVWKPSMQRLSLLEFRIKTWKFMKSEKDNSLDYTVSVLTPRLKGCSEWKLDTLSLYISLQSQSTAKSSLGLISII